MFYKRTCSNKKDKKKGIKMRATGINFILADSIERIDCILNGSNTYDEVDDIPKLKT